MWLFRREPQAQGPEPGQAEAPRAEPTAVSRVRTLMQLTNTGLHRYPVPNVPGNYPWEDVGQHEPLPLPDGRVARAPADGIRGIGALATSGSAHHPSMLRNLDIEPFTRVAAANHEYGIDQIVIGHHLCSIRLNQAGRAAQRQQAIFELLAPWIPADMIMTTADARTELGRVLSNTQALISQTWFLDGIRALQARHPFVQPADGQPAPNQHCSHRWNLTTNNWGRAYNAAEQLEVISEICQAMEERHRNRCLYSIVLLMVSFACQGSMSVPRMQRVITDLSQSMPGIADQLNASDIALTWRNFGHFVNDRTITGVLRRWLELVPQGAIRLRVILAQAAGSGLTQLDTIARAVNEHPEFPWIAFVRIYKDQWAAAMNAIRIVGDNPYFGYRRELGQVRSTLYRGLAWACAQLLIEMGDQALRNYQGFQEDRRNGAIVKQIIEGYAKSTGELDLEADLTQEEVDYLRENLPVARDYALTLVGRASMEGHDDPPAPNVQGGANQP